MAREFARTDRVGQQIQKEVAIILQREVKDPRLSMATVSAVEVSRDLAYAKVFVTFFTNEKTEIDESVAILNEAAGFIRSLLAKQLRARIMPQLRFVYDHSMAEGVRMTSLVDKAIAKDQERSGNGQADSEAPEQAEDK
ncbi:30S ribosome-binding factor RbfA [Thalassomonas actiniarum]|uniref:Ribosome-binding factor A n=1 Tax=Thalassomonas actiniarum TaxID=485447 RepID=A0AAE9YML2_9GAMM|nr:30S ribosome-binding factor RbfA [Thalassomonas actiniarum]WDD97632.1 30S ribosome-binding factor RbfA [Thalassomonas actiniarum]